MRQGRRTRDRKCVRKTGCLRGHRKIPAGTVETVRRGTVRTEDPEETVQDTTVQTVRRGTVRMEDPEEIVRVITEGTVRRGIVRTGDPEETVRVITEEIVRRGTARTEERIVRVITGITTEETVQTIIAETDLQGTVRMEGPEDLITADARTDLREDVRITAADRGQEIHLDVR